MKNKAQSKADMVKLSVRVARDQHNEIEKRARESNKSVNQFLIDAALIPQFRNDRQLTMLMGQLCTLQNILLACNDYDSLHSAVQDWRAETLRIVGW